MPRDSAIKTDQAPMYPFLAHPPPQKRRPNQPLPSPPSYAASQAAASATAAPPTRGPRRRSNTLSVIAAWASHVQPGSPASLSPRSPRSPRRRPSLGRGRRPSITSIRVTSGSFLNIIPTPTTAYGTTPSVRDFKADLTAVGYTSVFLQLPNTPISATVSLAVKPRSPEAGKNIAVSPPSPTRKPRGFTRFRSLSVLKSRGKSKSVAPSSPTKMKAKAAASSAAIVKRKRAKYALRPAPLANELALMQFADGGNMDDNIRRVMEAQAKAAGGTGVADVYRDGEGGVWWDQEEEWEYAHLLAEGEEGNAHATGELQWVTFGGDSSPSVGDNAGEERRGSVSTQDSDLDPRYIVQPTDQLDADDLAVFGSALAPLATRKPAMSVLALPARPRRAAKHLRKPDFLVDVAFSRIPASPKSPKFATSTFTGSGVSKPKGNARRRPAPLKLSPPSPALKRPTNSPVDAGKVRKDFLDASFEPVAPVTPGYARQYSRGKLTPSTRATNVPQRMVNESSLSLPMKKTIGKKPSMLNMMGLFRSSRKDDVKQCAVH
ncbi:hypothetical protein PAXINDRAFT_125697 [Paxillus involutus ATCC 200175]|nr:hypothetical protein PAXINDRAFT_125697 [Paxillus involutus ATCC 200175]